ncbi:MAG: glycosyltransferase [Puniceicoccaceae bacterium]|nr:glycosyltransferase [Puniceicoccaceae bacterium]
MKAVWIGGVFSEYALENYRAVNQAQNRWSLGLIQSLSDLGWSFHSLAFRAEQLWPKGVLRPGKDEDFHSSVTPLLVPTWNLPFIRKRSLPRAYLRKFKQHISKEGKPDIVISYNPLPWHLSAAKFAAKELNIPWISITLDLKYPGKNMEHFCALNQQASGQVILSWWGFENCPLEPKLHLDGGYDQLHPNDADYSEDTKKIILYSGKYTDYGGNDLLVDTIMACKRSDVEFWLLGKGENARINALSREDPRVRRMGFVSNAELDQCCRKAHVFLNPRPNAFADNLMTYPSKLLFYMAFGKPIISTWTPGLSPEYRSLFEIPMREDGVGFARSIDSLLANSSFERSYLRERMFAFLKASRSWKVQAHRLNEFAQKLK